MLAGEGFRAVLLFLGAQDVGGAAIAGEQVLAVLGFEQFSERLDPADDHEKIVLPRQREHRVDQIVPRAFFAEVDFQAIGEEGEEVRVDLEMAVLPQCVEIEVEPSGDRWLCRDREIVAPLSACRLLLLSLTCDCTQAMNMPP